MLSKYFVPFTTLPSLLVVRKKYRSNKYNTKGYGTITDEDLVGWIQVNLRLQSLALLLGFAPTIAYCLLFNIAWLLGFGANHSLLFIVQYWHHHIETRQIQ